MALRLIEMVLQEKEGEEVRGILKDQSMIEHRQIQLPDGLIFVRILLDEEESELALDLLEKRYSVREGNRVVILPVEATFPRENPRSITPHEKTTKPISQEELYENIKDSSLCSWSYLAMMMLSAIVGSVGLQYNSIPIIIGAMVIAPFLGPSMGLALGATLADLALVRRGLLTYLAGIGVVVAVAMLIGFFVYLYPAVKVNASHMTVEPGYIAVALASGCAGALSYTAHVSATLIGVMVAASLLPPLVAFGMLLGGGEILFAAVALSMFLMNMICVNLASVATFLVQGIRPTSWWGKKSATKSTFITLSFWIVLLAILISIILLLPKDLK